MSVNLVALMVMVWLATLVIAPWKAADKGISQLGALLLALILGPLGLAIVLLMPDRA